ncbi:ATP-binding cassette domain-containing protein [Bacillus suaedaesalsae]|uniref:ATP-binding cassette domain-containing protein n=1 Tax=Bacillus suaedaesalsae TaxID=2810349 RepID=A0ABS2DGZ8_9BACI|nr:ATP-binding cassette domain-containing protein [Bacillus suaedaesalsae]
MEPIIDLKKLRLKFPGEERLLLKDTNLTIYKGEKVLLLGPSGCGKSTLLQVLGGIIPRSIDVPMKAEHRQLPNSVGYVFQDPECQFCMPYVDEEIAFVLENLQVPRVEMRDKITEYLRKVGLHDVPLHTKINSLSGGQKQRLAIASILALEPEVLLLDEPTAMLDPYGTKQVWSTILDIMTDQTLIVVEHKIDHVIDLIERIIVFDESGEILVDSPKKEVIDRHLPLLKSHGIWYPGVWEEYLSCKVRRESSTSTSSGSIMIMKDFHVYRKKEVYASVDELKIDQGEWITVVGENGAGKSTLLLGMMQLLKTSGDYEIHGVRVIPKIDLSRKIAYVFQNPEFQFVAHSVFDEVAFSLRLEGEEESVIEKKVDELLTKFSLFDHRHKHPYQLSMGQKRRLSVATAILNKQKILLLDEPTFGQDSKNTFELLELLEKERKAGTVIVMITHDERIVENFATRKWMMKEGKIVEDTFVTKRKAVYS